MKRSKLANAFREAKKFIRVLPRRMVEDGNRQCNSFICYALDDAEAFGSINNLQKRMAQALIRQRLGDFGTVEDFLYHTIGHDAYYEATFKDPLVVQKYRLRWLDALINEYSK